jgi:hypothetical protein
MRALTLAGGDLVLVPQPGAGGEWPQGLYEAEMRVAAFQNGDVDLASTVHLTPVYCSSGIDDRDCMASG